jgi:hypothetical protein
MPTKKNKNKKELKIKAKVRDLKPRKDAKGGYHPPPPGVLGGLGGYGSH